MSVNKLWSLAASVALVVSIGTTAHAIPITGNLWEVSEATSQNAIPGNVPAGAPDVTFDVLAPLNFSATGATVNNWLLSGGAFNISGSAAALARLMDNGVSGTLVEFTGLVTVANGQSFTVTHDDGLTLLIGGLDLGFNPGPTSPVVTTKTYTGPSGTFPFQLVYGECCGGPAVLQVDLPFQPTPTPEPTSVLLIAGGLLFVLRRRTH